MDTSRLDPERTVIDDTAFIARGAVVVGDVHVGAHASVWFGVVVRGDSAEIRIGDRVNLQDNTVVHVDDDCPTVLEEGVSVGHACIIHGCTIRRGSLIGMGSLVMNNVEIGQDCLVGAGSLLTEGKVFPPRSLILGRPARVVRALTDDEIDRIRYATEHYVQAGQAYRERGHDDRS